MTKKTKVYKRRTHKFYGGTNKDVALVPVNPTHYEYKDSYVKWIDTLDTNLNLLNKVEGKKGFGVGLLPISIYGCFNYLLYISVDLPTRPLIKKLIEENNKINERNKKTRKDLDEQNKKLRDESKPIKEIILCDKENKEENKKILEKLNEENKRLNKDSEAIKEIILCDKENIKQSLYTITHSIEQLQKDYKLLKELIQHSEPMDTEIIFHFIMGCVESLLTYINEIWRIIRITGMDTFDHFSGYLNNKIVRFNNEIKYIKQIQDSPSKTIDGVEIFPVKIKDNVEFYKLWKRSREEPTKEITLKEVEDLLVPEPEPVGNKE
jgi:hypothetical protein